MRKKGAQIKSSSQKRCGFKKEAEIFLFEKIKERKKLQECNCKRLLNFQSSPFFFFSPISLKEKWFDGRVENQKEWAKRERLLNIDAGF